MGVVKKMQFYQIMWGFAICVPARCTRFEIKIQIKIQQNNFLCAHLVKKKHYNNM